MIKFHFGESGNDALRGPNESGIETFGGNKLDSLVREQGQNSIDARSTQSANLPVAVKYSLINFQASEVPGFQSLKGFVERSAAFWLSYMEDDAKLSNLFDGARSVWAGSSVDVLLIQDWNTTGLIGSKITDKVNPWRSLVRDEGVSSKPSGKGGSYGIGKNVFWLVSKARTVYFSTLDSQNVFAFRGKSLIPSWEEGDKTISTPGFCGIAPSGATVFDKEVLHPAFVPAVVGTQIAVLAPELPQDWEDVIKVAFLRNFLVALHEDGLVVELPSLSLTSAALPDIIRDLRARQEEGNETISSYWQVLTDTGAQTFSQEFRDLGAVSLTLLKHAGGTRKVMMCRGTGMKIYELSVPKVLGDFSGIFRCIDSKGNEFLRRLENPAHDRWDEYDRHPTPFIAKRAMAELIQWIRSTVRTFMAASNDHSIHVENFAELLSRPEVDDQSHQPDETLSERVIVVTPPKVKPQRQAIQSVPSPDTEGPNSEPGPLDEENLPHPMRPKSENVNVGDPPAPGGVNDAPGKSLVIQEIGSARIFRNGSAANTYRLSIKADAVRSIFLYAVGDDGRKEAVGIHAANVLVSGQAVPLSVESDGRIVVPAGIGLPIIVDVVPQHQEKFTFLVFGEVENA